MRVLQTYRNIILALCISLWVFWLYFPPMHAESCHYLEETSGDESLQDSREETQNSALMLINATTISVPTMNSYSISSSYRLIR